ncbi:MAG: HAD hydrolase family protein [Treponema sp.]
MNIASVFSDIDGTLLNSNHKITPLTLNAITHLQRKGVKMSLILFNKLHTI